MAYCNSILSTYNFGQHSVFVHSINTYSALIGNELDIVGNKR